MTARRGLIAFTGAALFVLTDGPLFFFAYSVLDRPEPPTWHDEVVAGGLALTAGGCGMLALWRLWRSRLKRPRPPQPLAATAVVAFVAAIAASAAWSIETLDTAGRAVIYAGLAVLAWLLADLEDDADKALTLMAAAGTAASLLVLAAGADAAFDPNRDWQGIYMSRNLLAPVAAVGVIAGIRMLCMPERRPRLAGAALGVGSILAMIGAGSRTAWLALAAGAGLTALPVLRHWLARHTDQRRARAAAWTALGTGLAAAAATVAVLWDTPTLAQRRTIWRVSWEQFLERPLHGHGFAAVWSSPEFLDNHELLDRGSAHNGALEVLLGLGLLGLVPFAVVVVLAVRNPARDLLRSPSAGNWMWAAVVAVMLVENITESFILRFSYNWVIIMAAALKPPSAAQASSQPPAARRLAGS